MSNIFIELSRVATERDLTEQEIATLNELLAKHPTLDRTLGVQYRAVGPDKMQLALEITEDHLQPWGVTNGGVYASLGETAGSMASFVAAGAGPAVVGTLTRRTSSARPSRATSSSPPSRQSTLGAPRTCFGWSTKTKKPARPAP